MGIYSVTAYFEKFWKSLFKRKVNFTYMFLFSPVLTIVTIYFTNAFVKSVQYYDILVNYGTIIVLGMLLWDATRRIIVISFRKPSYVIIQELTYMSLEEHLIYLFLISASYSILYNLVLGMLAVLFLNLSLFSLILVCFISILLSLTSLSMCLLFESIVLYFRGEGTDINNTLYKILRSFVPINFAIYVVKSKIGILIYAFPFVIFIEEFRKMLLGLEISLGDIYIASCFCILYFVIFVLVYRRVLYSVKKSGKSLLY